MIDIDENEDDDDQKNMQISGGPGLYRGSEEDPKIK